jgi:hypothetical protein
MKSVIPQTDTGEILFIKFPVGAFGIGFEPTQDSEQFTATENGFAICPVKLLSIDRLLVTCQER